MSIHGQPLRDGSIIRSQEAELDPQFNAVTMASLTVGGYTLPVDDGKLGDVMVHQGNKVVGWNDTPSLFGQDLSTTATPQFNAVSTDSLTVGGYTLPVDDGKFGDVMVHQGNGMVSWTPVVQPDIADPSCLVDEINGSDSNAEGPFATLGAAWSYMTGSSRFVGTGTITIVAGILNLGANPVIESNNISRLKTVVITGEMSNTIDLVTSIIAVREGDPIWQVGIQSGLTPNALRGMLAYRTSAGAYNSSWIRNNNSNIIQMMPGWGFGDSLTVGTLATFVTFSGTLTFNARSTRPSVIFRRLDFQSSADGQYAFNGSSWTNAVRLHECKLTINNIKALMSNLTCWGEAIVDSEVGTAGVYATVTVDPLTSRDSHLPVSIARSMFVALPGGSAISFGAACGGSAGGPQTGGAAFDLNACSFEQVELRLRDRGSANSINIESSGSAIDMQGADWQLLRIHINNTDVNNANVGLNMFQSSLILSKSVLNNCTTCVSLVQSRLHFKEEFPVPEFNSQTGIVMQNGSSCNASAFRNYATRLTSTQVSLGALGAVTLANIVARTVTSDFAAGNSQCCFTV